MLKAEYLDALRARLPGMPKKKLDALVAYYDAEIEERIKTNFDEEKAVSYMRGIEAIAEEQTDEASLFGLLFEKIRPKKKVTGGRIAAVVFLSFLWIILGVLLVALSFLLLVVLWLPSILTFAVLCAFCFDAALACYTGVGHAETGKMMQAVFFFGSTGLFAGAAILTAMVAARALRADAKRTKKVVRKLKNALIKRGKVR